MGLFVLQCKHREGDSSNPGNLIESPSAFNLIFWQKTGYPCMACHPYSSPHFRFDPELYGGQLISSPGDSIVTLVSPK